MDQRAPVKVGLTPAGVQEMLKDLDDFEPEAASLVRQISERGSTGQSSGGESYEFWLLWTLDMQQWWNPNIKVSQLSYTLSTYRT